MNRVVFNRAFWPENVMELVGESIRSLHTCGNGPFTRQCEQQLGTALADAKVLLTTSCTHALEMAAMLLAVGEGDEVIIPSFTFVSTANAFALNGAKPVFVDIRSDTLNLDEEKLEAAINERTKAIVVVHYAGIACEMDRILEIAGRHNVAVIEDNAHGLFGEYKGRPLGTLGKLGTLSFHETKNISCGEGGALIINDESLMKRAEIIREKGTNRSAFFRGEADKYTWQDLGSSYVMSDLLAAVLKAQLIEAEKIQSRRQRVWDGYFSELESLERAGKVRRPVVPDQVKQAYHLFYLLTNTAEERDELLAWLKARDIFAVFHYLPLHTSPMGRTFLSSRQLETDPCPVTTDVSQRLLRLPFFTDISEQQQDRVIAEIKRFFD